MIITLKGADFSASNIGTLSTWRITRSLGSGATYEGVTSVDKGAAFSATVTLAEGYEIGAAGVTVTMGGTVLSGAHTISGNVITITIASVTGNVLIKVPTINTSTGEEDEPDTPDEPTANYVEFKFNSNVENGVNLASAGTISNGTLTITTGNPLDYTGITFANDKDWTFEVIGLPTTNRAAIPLGTVSTVGGFVQIPDPTGLAASTIRFRDKDRTMSAEADWNTGYTVPTHFAIVYSATNKTLKMYMDYKEMAVKYSVGSISTFKSFTPNKLFGGYTSSTGTTYDYEGSLHYMRFTEAALTADQFHVE